MVFILGEGVWCMFNKIALRFTAFFLSLSLLACSKMILLHELEEREANEVVVLLDQYQISVDKEATENSGGGNKGPRFKIAVASADANRAWKILTDNQLPRKKDNGYSEVFAQSGLVPTAAEEKSKTVQAIQGELMRTLKSIDGILDARVHIVIPEQNALKITDTDNSKPTASVWFKYVAGRLPASVTEASVQELVANAVENLEAKHVKVIQTEAKNMEESIARGFSGGSVKLMGMTMASADATKFKIIMGVAVFLIVALSAGLIVVLIQLNSAKASNGTDNATLPAETTDNS